MSLNDGFHEFYNEPVDRLLRKTNRNLVYTKTVQRFQIIPSRFQGFSCSIARIPNYINSKIRPSGSLNIGLSQKVHNVRIDKLMYILPSGKRIQSSAITLCRAKHYAIDLQ